MTGFDAECPINRLVILAAYHHRMDRAANKPDMQWAIPLALSPFMLAIVVTMLLVVFVGDDIPRNIAYGSSLATWGLVVALISATAPFAILRNNWSQPMMRRMALGLCGLGAFMSWPVWTMGILPTVNGMHMGMIQTSEMRLDRLETSHASKSRQIYHWAYLQPVSPRAALEGGRYFVSANEYQRWTNARPQTVEISYATGLLGAKVVTAYR